jgi:16S rRNA (guanine527-N7)-methyltransferase
MNEEEARAWVFERFGVSRGTLVACYVDLLVEEAANQNLVAASTIPTIWERHIVDSAQLIPSAGDFQSWVDIGSGAGLPGLVTACLTDAQVCLVEPRNLRVEFLQRCATTLGIADRVKIVRGKAVDATGSFDIISARAVAWLGDLLDMTTHLAKSGTKWILPKGKSALEEVAAARKAWHGRFHVEPSITDPQSQIVIVEEARRR